MIIDELSDKQLADMVRNSIYAKNTSFGDGPTDARFLLVVAVPYGNDAKVKGRLTAHQNGPKQLKKFRRAK